MKRIILLSKSFERSFFFLWINVLFLSNSNSVKKINQINCWCRFELFKLKRFFMGRSQWGECRNWCQFSLDYYVNYLAFSKFMMEKDAKNKLELVHFILNWNHWFQCQWYFVVWNIFYQNIISHFCVSNVNKINRQEYWFFRNFR